MKKKLQVFISSTYTDLIDERQAAVQAVLDAGHIPAGMELFKAGNKSQFETIKKWIDESDVYMLILGGRYGSLELQSKFSYTEIEYNYAISRKKPVFSVVLKDSFLNRKVKHFSQDGILEAENLSKYEKFKEKVLSKIVKMVDDNKDIHIAVLNTLSEFNEEYDLSGWIKNEPVNSKQTSPQAPIAHHKCVKCAKEEYLPTDTSLIEEDNMECSVKINQWHSVNAGYPGYGSKLDSCNLVFELCDECLHELIQGFALKDGLIKDTYDYDYDENSDKEFDEYFIDESEQSL